MPESESTYPGWACTENVAKSFAAIAAASVVAAVLKLLPPQACAPPVPVVPIPEPRVRPTAVVFAIKLVATSGEGPKLLAPPASPEKSHAIWSARAEPATANASRAASPATRNEKDFIVLVQI